jgi:tetratricopeptide (TPR) repeat protein
MSLSSPSAPAPRPSSLPRRGVSREAALLPHLIATSLIATFLVITLASCMPGSEAPSTSLADEAPTQTPRLSDQLGAIPHPIETNSPLAQSYFNQGLTLIFGFNHEAAIEAFEEAIRLDPNCGACHWGIALALGPNINRPMGPTAAKRAHQEAQEAVRLTKKGSRDRAYAEALAPRYQAEPTEDRSALDLAYAESMRALVQANPDDFDAAVLFAESLMDLTPWAYWTSEAKPRKYTNELIAALESVLEREPRHVGANHYYIHAVEEYFPERAEAAADRLATLAPEAGHLVHMPSHIYWRIGRYDDAADINARASEADEKFFAWCRGGNFYRAAYYPHNVHFLWAAAAAEGRQDLALMTARKLAAVTKGGLKEVPTLQEFVAIPMLTMARFGMWDALFAETKPSDDDVYLAGIWQYTRGLAELRDGYSDYGRAARYRLGLIIDDPRSAELILAGGTASARALLEIAAADLDAELALSGASFDDAVSHLERATVLHDALPYMEPPPWYAPPRQALGAVLLDLGRAAEAEAVYLEDLKQYPKNGWSLFGLAKSFELRGDDAKAEWARQGHARAWARADVKLERTRF